MALVLADRIKETTTTTGTGTYTLAGAVTGFESFATIGNTNTTYYCCTDGTDFEVGVGTYASSGTTLARTTILQSSNSDNAVNWSSGTRDIFCTQPAEKAVFEDASGDVDIAGGATFGDTVTINGDGNKGLLIGDEALSASNDYVGMKTTNMTGTSDYMILSGVDSDGADSTFISARSGSPVFIRGGGNDTAHQIRVNASLAKAYGIFEVGTQIELGHASDTTLTRSAAGTVQIEGNTILTTADTGISNGNVAVFTSGAVDNDFLRVDGTSIEGRSASEVLSDIGGQASLTFGISNTNAVKIDSSSVADDEYARFTANGLESRATSEVLSDIGAQASLTFGISNTNAVKVDSSSVADDEYARFTANGLESRSTSEVLSDIGAQASLTFGISNTNAVKIDSASVADDEFARFTANGLESRSASEVRSDIGLGTAAVAATGISNGNVPVFTSGVADNDFLRVNGTSIEGRSASELASDIGASTTDDATALAIALG